MSTDHENADYRSSTSPGDVVASGTAPAPGVDASQAGSDIAPYVIPMIAYVALGGIDSYLPAVDGVPSPFWYPLAYAARVVVVGLLAWRYRATWNDFRPWPRVTTAALAIVIGIVVWAMWIGLDGRYPAIKFLGTRGSFDLGLLTPARRGAFIVVRMLGLVVLVPVVEELFWRSFLMRWLVDPEFQKVPIGTVTPVAAVVTSIMFAMAHPEWLPALLTGALWAWLLWHTRSLAACAISHAVANLALGIYVIATGDWKYW